MNWIWRKKSFCIEKHMQRYTEHKTYRRVWPLLIICILISSVSIISKVRRGLPGFRDGSSCHFILTSTRITKMIANLTTTRRFVTDWLIHQMHREGRWLADAVCQSLLISYCRVTDLLYENLRVTGFYPLRESEVQSMTSNTVMWRFLTSSAVPR